MLEKATGIVQFHVGTMGGTPKMLGLGDDGRIYEWDSDKGYWIMITVNKFDD